MTAYTPHTPPLWRRVLSLPQTRLGWWAIGLASVSVVILIHKLTAGFFEFRALEKLLEELIGWVLSAWVLSGLAGGVVGLIAVLRRHERSWLVWVAMVMAVLSLPVIPFAVQWWLYVLNSPWYSP